MNGSTGADGAYAASGIDLGSGNVPITRSVTTSKAGYWTSPETFTAELGSPKVVDVKLLKQCTATIVGTVRNAKTLLPISGATEPEADVDDTQFREVLGNPYNVAV